MLYSASPPPIDSSYTYGKHILNKVDKMRTGGGGGGGGGGGRGNRRSMSRDALGNH